MVNESRVKRLSSNELKKAAKQLRDAQTSIEKRKEHINKTKQQDEKDYSDVGRKHVTVGGVYIDDFLSNPLLNKKGERVNRDIRSSDVDFNLAPVNTQGLKDIDPHSYEMIGIVDKEKFISGQGGYGDLKGKSMEDAIYESLLSFKLGQYGEYGKGKTFEDAGLNMVGTLLKGFETLDEKQKSLLYKLQSADPQTSKDAYNILIYTWNRAASRYRSEMRRKINAGEIAPDALKRRAQMLNGIGAEMGNLGTQNWNLLTKDFNGMGGSLMLSLFCPPMSLVFILPILLPAITAVASGIVSQRSNEKALSQQEIYALNKAEIVTADIISCTMFESLLSDVAAGKSMTVVEEGANLYVSNISSTFKNNGIFDELKSTFEPVLADGKIKENSKEFKSLVDNLSSAIGPHIETLSKMRKALDKAGVDITIATGDVLMCDSHKAKETSKVGEGKPNQKTSGEINAGDGGVEIKYDKTKVSIDKGATTQPQDPKEEKLPDQGDSTPLEYRLRLANHPQYQYNKRDKKKLISNYFVCQLLEFFKRDPKGTITAVNNKELSITMRDDKYQQDKAIDFPQSILKNAAGGIATANVLLKSTDTTMMDLVKNFIDNGDVISSAKGSTGASLMVIEGLLRPDLWMDKDKNIINQNNRRAMFKKYLSFMALAALPATISVEDENEKENPFAADVMLALQGLMKSEKGEDQIKALSLIKDSLEGLEGNRNDLLQCLIDILDREIQFNGANEKVMGEEIDSILDEFIKRYDIRMYDKEIKSNGLEYDKMLMDNIEKNQQIVNMSFVNHVIKLSKSVFRNSPVLDETPSAEINTGTGIETNPSASISDESTDDEFSLPFNPYM